MSTIPGFQSLDRVLTRTTLFALSLLLSGCYTVDSLVDAPDAKPGDGICARALTVQEISAGEKAPAPDPRLATLRDRIASVPLSPAELQALARGETDLAKYPEIAKMRREALTFVDRLSEQKRIQTRQPLGLCTLRAAIMEANANPWPARILVPEGQYALGLPTAPNGAGGSLLIKRGMRIQGSGAALTAVIGRGMEPVFFIDAPSTKGKVEMNLLSVTKGYSQGGGGLYVSSGTTELEDVTIQDNEAFTGGGGMAIAEGATVVLRRSMMIGNKAIGFAGGAVWNKGSLLAYDSTFSGNQSNRAGAIHNSKSGRLILTNVTISANQSDVDDPTGPGAGTGGIHQNGLAVLNNVTITKNRGTADRAGGILIVDDAKTVMKNSIVADNNAMGGSADCKGKLTADSQFNLIGNSAGCVITTSVSTYRLDIPASLGPLQDNGGPTPTHLPAVNSAARDSAYGFPPPAVDACAAADQRGVPRPQGLGGCDLGAVEYTDATAEVTGFVLVDATTNMDIRPLRNEDWLVLADLPPQLAIRAEVRYAAGSVAFQFSSAPGGRVENQAPYALAGDNAGDYTPLSLVGGEYKLSATPFVGTDGTGAAGAARTIRFDVFQASR